MLKTAIRAVTYANAYLAPKNFVNIDFIDLVKMKTMSNRLMWQFPNPLSFFLSFFIRTGGCFHQRYMPLKILEDDFAHRFTLQGRLDFAPQFCVDVSHDVVHTFTAIRLVDILPEPSPAIELRKRKVSSSNDNFSEV
jgi:hypothetical protein